LLLCWSNLALAMASAVPVAYIPRTAVKVTPNQGEAP
jgi:hypothetical protein